MHRAESRELESSEQIESKKGFFTIFGNLFFDKFKYSCEYLIFLRIFKFLGPMTMDFKGKKN